MSDTPLGGWWDENDYGDPGSRSIAPDTPSVCPTCDDTGLVAPLGGRGSDGPDPCPHCTPAAGSPSPDVAALAERLRDDGLRARHHDEVLTADDACRWGGVGALLWAEDMIEAADALEAQAARITELEAAIRAALHRATMRSSPDYELEDVLGGDTDGG